MSSHSQTFGSNCRKYRESKGFSQDELGKAAGLGRATIAAIEAGNQSVSVDQALSIASSLGVPLDQMLGISRVQIKDEIGKLPPEAIEAIKKVLNPK